MPPETTGLHVNPSDETIRLGPLAVRFLLTGDDSTGSVAAFELAVPAAQRLAAPAHSHDHYEETVYGIAGVLTWTVDGTPIDVGPGQALCIPRGAIHRFDNNGSQDVKALCLVTPAALGPQYFREAAEVMNATAGWATGPREDGGDHAPPRPHADSAPASDVALLPPMQDVNKTFKRRGAPCFHPELSQSSFSWRCPSAATTRRHRINPGRTAFTR